MTRIIAGIARGRQLKVPPEGTRPTSDRAREGLFSSLQARFGFSGQRVLDLFAGSGALGLEAVSRGANSVVLVDSAESAVSVTRANAMTVLDSFSSVDAHGVQPRVPRIDIVHAKASTYLSSISAGEIFTMVLADPPYDMPDSHVTEMLDVLSSVLAEGAVVVIERHRDSPETAWPEGFEPTKQKLKKRIFGIARFDMAIWNG